MGEVLVMKRKWSIHQIYFYLVCFVTLIMVISGITSVVRAGIQIVIPIPDSERSYFDRPMVELERYQANSALPKEVIEEEAARREAFNQSQNKSAAYYGPWLMVINGLIQILVAVPVYLYHWRRIPSLN